MLIRIFLLCEGQQIASFKIDLYKKTFQGNTQKILLILFIGIVHVSILNFLRFLNHI